MSDDVYLELRESKAELLQMFASPGWKLLNKWLNAQIEVSKEKAYALPTLEEREQARVEGLSMEKVIQLAVFLADHAGLNNVEGASEIPLTTPEAM